MTLLDRRFISTTGTRTVPLYPGYYLKSNPDVCDVSLTEVCGKSPTLTMEPEGFSEIGITDVELRKDYMRFYEPQPLIDKPLDELSVMLINRIKDYLVECWDSNKPHLISAGGGADSRLILYILKSLERELGKDWLGEIRIICHQSAPSGIDRLSEGDVFKRLMKAQGWKPDQYCIHKEKTCDGEDYFDIGNPLRNPNSFHNTPFVYWDDVVPLGQENDWVWVTGLMGGEMLSWHSTKLPHRTIRGFMGDFDFVRPHYAYHYNEWLDVITPYASYEYLDLVFRLPDKAFYRDPKNPVDMRHRMLGVFRDKTLFYVGHIYNFKISQRRLAEMTEFYLGSKFYRDFGVKTAFSNFPRPESYSSGFQTDISFKLFGYAVMYEKAKGGN